MTKIDTKLTPAGVPASPAARAAGAATAANGEAVSPHRSMVDWNETMLDYAAIEKRAQEMRSEAAWAIFGAVRDWTVNLFRQGKAKAQAAAQAPLKGHAQSS